MSFSFSINSKSQSNCLKRSSASYSDAAESDSSTINYVTEFHPDEAPPPPESKIKPIAPIPNEWCPNRKLRNLDGDSALQFEVDPGCYPESFDSSMGYGLHLRPQSATASDAQISNGGETVLDLELRKLREDLAKLPEGPGVDEYEDVPIEGFGAALLYGYGWKEGRGIGRNAKKDVKVYEFRKKLGRGGLGFMGELPDNRIDTNVDDVEDLGNANGRREKMEEAAEDGSSDEEKYLKRLKELKVKEKDLDQDKKDRNLSRERGQEEEKASERVNWLRNQIRVRIISKDLKGGRLYLRKGVVVDVGGPRMCDISIDESRELVQGVEQELLETALPKCGGPVLVLYGRHKGVYGSLLEQDSEKGMGVVQDADTHELVNVKLEQIAEYTGDPSDIGY